MRRPISVKFATTEHAYFCWKYRQKFLMKLLFRINLSFRSCDINVLAIEPILPIALNFIVARILRPNFLFLTGNVRITNCWYIIEIVHGNENDCGANGRGAAHPISA